MSDPDSMVVFDRGLVRRHRDRAAAGLGAHDFLLRHVGAALLDRLFDVARAFPLALDVGGHGGETAALLLGRKGIRSVVTCDLSSGMAARQEAGEQAHMPAGLHTVVADEERLPFAAGAFDLAVSNLSLHWTNDLPGALVQIRHALKPDGLFLGALLGGDTLFELRRAMMEAELAVAGGASPRVSPFAELRDIGGLLQRAGFALPVADAETLTVTYGDAFRLVADLRGMGETAAHLSRNRRIPPRAFWPEVARRYAAMFALADGRIPATFQVIFMAGWAPAATQQQPLRPGSATARLADALGAAERSAGDKALPKR